MHKRQRSGAVPFGMLMLGPCTYPFLDTEPGDEHCDWDTSSELFGPAHRIPLPSRRPGSCLIGKLHDFWPTDLGKFPFDGGKTKLYSISSALRR